MNHIHIVITGENGQQPIHLQGSEGLEQLYHSILNIPRDTQRGIDEQIGMIFLTLGIPASVKGFRYLREAIKLTISEPNAMTPITKRLYPAIAERYGVSAASVERSIRHAISIAWLRGRVETLNDMLGCRVFSALDKPSNSELIALIAERLPLFL